jgi:nucleotide-binding universal stress UspA family protein
VSFYIPTSLCRFVITREEEKEMYSKLLVPLDGSRLSEGILPYARTIAKTLNVPVELLQVIDPDVISALSDPPAGRYVGAVGADMKRNSEDYLKSVAGSFLDTETINYSAEIGNPAGVIADRAAAHSGTLIAMATHGRSGAQQWFLGSVANKVLHAATKPLLLVWATEKSETSKEAPLNTVLVPLDGSSLAEHVLPHVAAIARNMNLEVVLMRVYSVVTQSFMEEGFVRDIGQISDSMKQEAKKYLDEKVKQLRAEELNRVSCLVLEGDSSGEIIDLARRTPNNLVAMCTHGRSGIGRWALGSVTDRVVRHSGDPVLIIRAPAAGSQS